jgi:hypothetical protein
VLRCSTPRPIRRGFFPFISVAAIAAALPMTTTHEPLIAVGQFVVSPLVTRTDSGRYAASAVVRSGSGRATHHRVLRFVPRFSTRESAQRYAVEHGIAHASSLIQPEN